MGKVVVMPKLGLTMTEGTIDEWKKNEGDAVKEGEVLFSVSTDKLTNDIEAPASGTLLKIAAKAGEPVPVLAPVAFIGEPGEKIDLPEAAAPAGSAAPAAAEGGSVLVIGGGPGGYVAAIRAAQLGGKVTLVEKAEVGGTASTAAVCPQRPCCTQAKYTKPPPAPPISASWAKRSAWTGRRCRPSAPPWWKSSPAA